MPTKRIVLLFGAVALLLVLTWVGYLGYRSYAYNREREHYRQIDQQRLQRLDDQIKANQDLLAFDRKISQHCQTVHSLSRVVEVRGYLEVEERKELMAAIEQLEEARNDSRTTPVFRKSIDSTLALGRIL